MRLHPLSYDGGAEDLRCPKCGKRIGFNQRGTNCPKCGAWLLSRPPSEHMIRKMQRAEGRDDFLNDFPWIGGSPGRRAVRFTVVWVVLLVALAISIIVSIVTMHFIIAIALIFLTAVVGSLPQLFLISSRI